MARPLIESMCPFFIVSHVAKTIAFYEDKLGFQTCWQEPEEDPLLAVFRRDGASLIVKAGVAAPLPNPKRDPAMRWDAYCDTLEPDALAAELAGRGVPFSNPLNDTEEGLRGFEITDPDDYVIFFGCPKDMARSRPNE